MAIIPSSKYAGQVDTSDAAYPLGKAQCEIVEGDNTGTPLHADWISDLWGFLQTLLVEGAVTPSGAPDKVGASQYLTALKHIAFEWTGAHKFDAAVTVTNEINFAALKNYAKVIPMSAGVPASFDIAVDPPKLDYDTSTLKLCWSWPVAADFAGHVYFDPDLPSGAIVTGVKLLVKTTGGAGMAVTAHFTGWPIDWVGTAGQGATVDMWSCSSAAPALGNAVIDLTVGSGSPVQVIDRANNAYSIRVEMQDNGTPDSSGKLLGILVEYQMPGYRNG